jgi:chromosome segregation ATPase
VCIELLILCQFSQSDGGRYQAKEPPEGVDTVSTVLSIMEPLVFNCLIDQTNADQVALMTSKESSERSLLIEGNGRSSIRGNNIKKVFFLPNGDFWQVSKAGSLSIISSSKRLTQTIGLDKTRAIQEAEREIDLLRTELRNADDDFSKVRREREDYRKNWNTHMSKLKNNDADIKKLENDIDDLRGEAEAAVNVTYDTSDLEDEAKAADEAYQALKEKESDCQKAIDELQPAAQALKRSIEEISARNSKIVADINATEKKMEDIVRNQTEKLRSVDKKRAKVDEAENALKQQRAILEDKVKKNDEALSKARTVNWKYKKASAAREETSDGNVLLNADLDGNKEPDLDEIASIEPMKTDREPDFYKNKIQRAEKEVEKEKVKRNLSEKDPEVAYEKYMRAKKDIDSKLQQIEQIKINIESLKKDLKSRRKMWKRFRSHICDMTSNTFDEILNKKGSSGQIEFNHENKELNLTVQKDNRNSMTQTSDVKALR